MTEAKTDTTADASADADGAKTEAKTSTKAKASADRPTNVSPLTDTSSGTRPRSTDEDHDPETLTEAEKNDQEYQVSLTPVDITAVDALGVERIVTQAPQGYVEPQVDPDPHEVARLKRLQGLLNGQKQDRLDAIKTSPDGSARVAAKALKAEANVGVAAS